MRGHFAAQQYDAYMTASSKVQKKELNLFNMETHQRQTHARLINRARN